MSDTPRTDAVRFAAEATTANPVEQYVVTADFARELERELAAKSHALELSNTAYSELERENARLREALHWWTDRSSRASSSEIEARYAAARSLLTPSP
jgi:hypothetical protein